MIAGTEKVKGNYRRNIDHFFCYCQSRQRQNSWGNTIKMLLGMLLNVVHRKVYKHVYREYFMESAGVRYLRTSC